MILKSGVYEASVAQLAKSIEIKNCSVLVTGATGLIGSCILDALVYANRAFNQNNKIYALGRSAEKFKSKFGGETAEAVSFLEQDVTTPIDRGLKLDYILHLASNADPQSYALYPAETIITNVYGAKNILDYCKENKGCKALLASTFEVYGKHESDEYAEADFGRLDHNSIRSGYPESKRVAELLAKSYQSEYGVNCVIARLASIYGPTMLKNDSKAHAQFIRSGVNGEDIVLKSEGKQRRTYCYVMDAASGIFTVLLKGAAGEAYNVANPDSVVTISEFAHIVAKVCGTKVTEQAPRVQEQSGYSKPQSCILSAQRLEELGWRGSYSIYDGIKQTVDSLMQMHDERRRGMQETRKA